MPNEKKYENEKIKSLVNKVITLVTAILVTDTWNAITPQRHEKFERVM